VATETQTVTPVGPDLAEVGNLLAQLTELTQAMQNGGEFDAEKLRELTGKAVDLARPVLAHTGIPLLRYSMYLHVGAGADKCQDGADGTCGDPLHFHAWLRLPNQFQHEQIREKALAGKARRLRLLRDEDSDARIILDEELDEIRRAIERLEAMSGQDAEVDPDSAEHPRRTLVDELVTKEWWKDQLAALKEVEEQDDFEHITEDRERMRELERAYGEAAAAATDGAMPEIPEELVKLREHFEAYAQAVDKAMKELQQPKYDALKDKSVDELVDLVRDQRMEADGDATFAHIYSTWTWLLGTYTTALGPDKKHHTRRFSDLADLKEAEPEVIEAIQTSFTELESTMQRGTPAGNS
jgi:soluble cytochrome b562